MSYNGKTDWKLDDTVLNSDLNRIEKVLKMHTIR
ncbi:hypothetical protein PAV_11c00480 [Paenibacillus alvei DSM 29]|nr:hypothetical protein PAV_11c00480 [Paenibacillus alvei DSM 29]